MICGRCRGLMVPDQRLDIPGAREVSVWSWRCVSCGQIIDPVVLKNRALQRVRPRVRPAAEVIFPTSRGMGDAA